MADIEIDITSAQQEQPDIDVHPIYGLKGAQGERGLTGNGISSITLASSVGLVDTYTVTYTNGTTTTFTVANGNGVQSIEKTSTDGLVDTYTITFDNGNETTYTVTNGAKGDTGEQGIQGVQGERGDTGATPDITMTASVNNTVGTPSVTVTESGTAEEPVFNLAFSNLKGEQGVSVTGVTLQSTVGLDKTYRMTFSDNTYFDFVVSNGAAGSTEWGGISGVLSNQTDLQTALNNKANISDIPIVNNATLTIQKNNVTAGTFTANSATDTTININETTYYAGTGISITPKLQTTVDVTCSNPDLTVVSSYDDTESSTGVMNYDFEYNESAFHYSGGTQAEQSPFIIYKGQLLFLRSYNGPVEPVVADSEQGWTYISANRQNRSYGIKDGKLYKITYTYVSATSSYTFDFIQIGTETNWTVLSGDTINSDYYAYGICGGKLYALQDTTATQVGADTTWTKISGSSRTNSSAASQNYAYGINNGRLYYLYGTTATQIGTDSTWSDIAGESKQSSSSNFYAYGINNGKLYCLSISTATQIGSSTTWTKLSGYFSLNSSSPWYAFAIDNGKLYSLLGTTATQIGTDTAWTDIRGTKNSDAGAIGIADGKLYVVNTSTATQIGSDTGWSDLSGTGYPDTFAIRDNNLYYILNISIYNYATTLIGNVLETGWVLNNTAVNLADYDLTVTGTPQVNDTIDLTYTTTEVANQYVISANEGA